LVVGKVTDNEGSLFTVTLVLGLIFVGMGGLTIFTLPCRQQTAGSSAAPPTSISSGPRPALFTPTTADHNAASITTGRTP